MLEENLQPYNGRLNFEFLRSVYKKVGEIGEKGIFVQGSLATKEIKGKAIVGRGKGVCKVGLKEVQIFINVRG